MYARRCSSMAIFIAVRGEGPPETEAVLAALGAGARRDRGARRLLPRAGDRDDEHRRADRVDRGRRAGDRRRSRPAISRGDRARSASSAAIIGVVLASREDGGGECGPREQRQSILLALVAGVGFGSYFVAGRDRLARRRRLGAAAVARRGGAGHRRVAILVAAPRRVRAARLRPRGRRRGSACCDLAANAALQPRRRRSATCRSSRSASSLYPVTTVLLARDRARRAGARRAAHRASSSRSRA